MATCHIHPGVMVALLLYACSQAIYCSWRIAKACEEWLDFAVVTGMQRPGFRTVDDFRKRHLAALSGLICTPADITRTMFFATLASFVVSPVQIRQFLWTQDAYPIRALECLLRASPRL